jgi:hypothetical protein
MGRRHNRSQRPQHEIVAGVRRVQAEGPVPVADLMPLAGCSERRIADWIVTGKRGLWLDGFHHPIKGWMSSEKSMVRFLAEVARRTEEAELASQEERDHAAN